MPDAAPPPDLAADGAAPPRAFPLDVGGTRVVLYAGMPGEIRAYWQLDADDLMRSSGAFAVTEGAPSAVLRLYPLAPPDAAAPPPAAERRLPLTGPGGRGETGFPVGREPRAYRAELGLTNPRGGWLALARSNRLAPAATRPFRLDRPRRAAARTSPVAVTPPEPIDGGVPPPAVVLSAAIPVLDYGAPLPRGVCLTIAAELSLHGQATPNSEIDLFGQPYRVGPGGRFQLRFRIEDPDLLRRALALHPPAVPERGGAD